ncbi:hypothetical protein D9M70_645370 [compost metagenome]
MGGDHRAMEHRLIKRQARLRRKVNRAIGFLERHGLEENLRLFIRKPAAQVIGRLRILAHIRIPPADHRCLHPMGKQHTLGRGGVAILGAGR